MYRRRVAVNYYHKTLHLGCCSSPRSASGFLSSSEDIKHSATPAASIEPEEPSWFISHSLWDKNSS